MPFTYFIADIHLSAERDDITECLLTFLEQDAPQAEALYVLGDLFEFWLGDDDVTPLSERVASAFKALSATTPVFFIHGNRDFAIREGWTRKAGMTLLPEQQVIDLYGTPTLLLHGDELCTLDIEYQKFRKKALGMVVAPSGRCSAAVVTSQAGQAGSKNQSEKPAKPYR